MVRVFAVIDDAGYSVDMVSLPEEDEHGNPVVIPSNHVEPNYTKRLFTPRYDIETNEWVEGLSPEEVAEREREIANNKKSPSDEEINAMAIMELTALLMGGE